MRNSFLARGLAVSAALLFTAASPLLEPQRAAAQSLAFTSGQPVYPAYEGWEKNEDGSFNMVFGYMNDNWKEEPTVAVGPENFFAPGPQDQSQPTHFLPRRNRFIFRVKVPKDFGSKELVWNLTTHGKVQKAYGSLRPDLIIENVDIMSETGALGAGSSSPELRADKPPVILLSGARTRTARVDEVITLDATVTDDGIPKTRAIPANRVRQASMMPPARPTVAKNLGLHLAWFVYRGSGGVTFDPPQIKIWEDTRAGANSPWAPIWIAPPVPEGGKYSVKVRFPEPGTYVLAARADDGALTSDELVTVTVTK